MPTRTFDYTGEWVKWNVPEDVEVVVVEMTGGGSNTRQGGRVTGNLRVKGVDAVWIQVGRKGFAPDGRNGGKAAFGGAGAGGDGGGPGKDGGWGGGGASAIRFNKQDGQIRAVAGGAGGASGDGSAGGIGGGDGVTGTGMNGTHSAAPGSTIVGDATGGTANQAGKGGTVKGYSGLWGSDGEQQRLGHGGRGGQSGLNSSHGGGGGGGGWYPGGGGQGAVIGVAPGGGGGAGSNYIEGMYGAQSFRGSGGSGHGSVTFTWDTTNPPVPPGSPSINAGDGWIPLGDETPTKSGPNATLRGKPADPNFKRGVRMHVWMSQDSEFKKYRVFNGTFDDSGDTDKVDLTNLEPNTLYYLRLYSKNINGAVSPSYASHSFWTDRNPNPPELVAPAENSQVMANLNVTFDWNVSDPDPDDPQSAWRLRYRTVTSLGVAGDWVTIEHTGSASSWVIDAGTFKGNTFYEWSARTADQRGRWGDWASPKSFYVIAETTPPDLISPIKNEGIVLGEDNTFRWKFKSPGKQVGQQTADLRYRIAGSEGIWTTIFGDPVTPGPLKFLEIPAGTFGKFRYEWQVRTTDTNDLTSEWSSTAYFWAAATPGSGAGLDPIISDKPSLQLGQGHNRALVFMRGGTEPLGELGPLEDITWKRVRDDISTNTLHMTSWDKETRALLRSLRSWKHEIVVFRDNGSVVDRVHEGPITRISSQRGGVEIEWRDVMAYPYRRILRQGYNDSYRVVDGQQTGLSTVTKRARQILLNCLAYDDPNVLPYLTTLTYYDDARSSRSVPDFSKTAWEEIDDLAAHAGLDYTTSGRRIVLWDTHRPVGRLPEMRDGHFDESPIITEYGANLANVLAATNNSGIYGIATRGLTDGEPGEEGFVEQLVSSYSETEGAGAERTMTREAKRKLEASLREQAQRSIANRYTKYGPSPKVVRIPDNASLVPSLPIGIQQLIPGVWIPLRCDDGVQDISQWQKLDSVTVTEDSSGETVRVVMSAAPNNGNDPDADEAAEEEG